MPILHTCETIYSDHGEISDINPLLLQRYRGKRLLVICARDAQVFRIKEKYPDIPVFGWWEAAFFKKVDEHLAKSDVVILVGRSRIDELFDSIVTYVEKACTKYSPKRN